MFSLEHHKSYIPGEVRTINIEEAIVEALQNAAHNGESRLWNHISQSIVINYSDWDISANLSVFSINPKKNKIPQNIALIASNTACFIGKQIDVASFLIEKKMTSNFAYTLHLLINMFNSLQHYLPPWIDSSWLDIYSITKRYNMLMQTYPTCSELETNWLKIFKLVPNSLSDYNNKTFSTKEFPQLVTIQTTHVENTGLWYGSRPYETYPVIVKKMAKTDDDNKEFGAKNGIMAVADNQGQLTMFACGLRGQIISCARPIEERDQAYFADQYTRLLKLQLIF